MNSGVPTFGVGMMFCGGGAGFVGPVVGRGCGDGAMLTFLVGVLLTGCVLNAGPDGGLVVAAGGTGSLRSGSGEDGVGPRAET